MAKDYIIIPFRNNNIDFPSSSLSSSSSSSSSSLLQPEIIKDFTMPTPPPAAAYFSLKREILQGWHIHTDMLPSLIVAAGTKSAAGWTSKALDVISEFERASAKSGLFIKPFFALCVWHLRDGSRMMPTPPVLLTPNTTPPYVAGKADFSLDEMEMEVNAALTSLQCRITIPPAIREWSDRIVALDIMVSKPMEFYDSKSTPLLLHRYEGHEVVWKLRDTSFSPLDYTEFTLLKSFSLDSISGDIEFSSLNTDLTCLPDEKYTPDYLHWSKVTAAGKSSFAGRDIIWDLSLSTPEYLPIEQMVGDSDDITAPSWIFHPSPFATTYEFDNPAEDGAGQRLSLQLTRHPKLHGAYYFAGLKGEPQDVTALISNNSGSRDFSLPTAIWRSSERMRLLYPDALLMNLPDVKRVIAVWRAFRASGLVATTMPTAYCFTDAGVFLLKETDSGLLKDAGLITAYVLADAESLTVKAKGVEFTTTDGERIYLEGTKVTDVTGESSSTSGNSGSSSSIISVYVGEEGGTLVTKPLPLTDCEELKRVRRVKLRGEFDPRQITMEVYGSRDGLRWQLLGYREGGYIVGMLPAPLRFYKVKIKVTAGKAATLVSLSFVCLV